VGGYQNQKNHIHTPLASKVVMRGKESDFGWDFFSLLRILLLRQCFTVINFNMRLKRHNVLFKILLIIMLCFYFVNVLCNNYSPLVVNRFKNCAFVSLGKNVTVGHGGLILKVFQHVVRTGHKEKTLPIPVRK
jgi:uncharacterized membrane protein (DUF485 family)